MTMKIHRNSWLAAGASLLLALVAQPVHAAQVLYNTGELLLAFRASSGQGASQSLLVNIGAASTYQSASSTAVIDLALGNLGADLVSQFGADWYDRTDLTWSVFGANDTSSPNAILWASRAQTTYGTDATPWPLLSEPGDRTATRANIASVTSAFDVLDATANSTLAALQSNSSSASSYAQQVTAGVTDFGSSSQWTNIEGSFGVGEEALNLFRLTGSSTTNFGKFTISTTGQVTFNGTAVVLGAVPEPSKAVFAMLGAGALLLRRRRPSQAMA